MLTFVILERNSYLSKFDDIFVISFANDTVIDVKASTVDGVVSLLQNETE